MPRRPAPFLVTYDGVDSYGNAAVQVTRQIQVVTPGGGGGWAWWLIALLAVAGAGLLAALAWLLVRWGQGGGWSDRPAV